ncbi:hypothetical protein BGX34_005608, partial [Mortierella sp. NVP85]
MKDFDKSSVVSASGSTMPNLPTTEGEEDCEQESSGVSRLVDFKHIQWLLKPKLLEGVSFASFVEHFGFVNLEDAKAAYERLINSSRLPMDRRRTLQAAYQLFLRNKLQSFWPDHLLKMEKQMTKTKFMIAVTKSARVVQKASVKEIANIAKSLEDDGDHQDESVCALKSIHKPE